MEELYSSDIQELKIYERNRFYLFLDKMKDNRKD